MNTREIQIALQAKGFDPGPIDGIRGRLTIAAIKAFQTANGLVRDGIVGPRTSALLFGGRPPKTMTPVSGELPWLAEAWRLIGVDENTRPGQSNPLIEKWASDLAIGYGDDSTAWCGLFVAHCIGSQLPGEPLPDGPLGAKNWRRFGDHCGPQPGAVMVFWRGSPNAATGHVAFYIGEDETHYHILGGNQSDTVSVIRMPKERFTDSRWPKTAMPAAGKRYWVSADGTPVTDGNEQ